MTKEAVLKTKIRHWLIHEKHAYFFAPVQMGMGVSTLDILCCIDGRFVGIEAKVPGKTPTPRQEMVIAAIKNAGGIAFWTDSLEHTQRLLEAYQL